MPSALKVCMCYRGFRWKATNVDVSYKAGGRLNERVGKRATAATCKKGKSISWKCVYISYSTSCETKDTQQNGEKSFAGTSNPNNKRLFDKRQK